MRRTRARCHRESRTCGRTSPVADGGDEEHEAGIDELAEHGRRRGVDEVGVVDEQHERAALHLCAQNVADLRDDRDEVAALRARPAGRSGASTPSGTLREPSVAVARATVRPWPSAAARH